MPLNTRMIMRNAPTTFTLAGLNNTRDCEKFI
jgi:hypothetical protein